MNLQRAFALLTTLLLPFTTAIFADQAYITDFHHALLGLPQSQTTFFAKPYPASKAALVYTISEKKILAAVNPRDGTIVWRQPLQRSGYAAGDVVEGGVGAVGSVLRKVEAGDTVVALDGGRVSAWSGGDGKLVWDFEVAGGRVVDVEVPDMPNAEGRDDNQAVVLFQERGQGWSVKKVVDDRTGKMAWTHVGSAGEMPLRIAASATTIFAITAQGLRLKVTSLDPVTGNRIDEHTLSSDSDLTSPSDILYVGSNSASHILAWTDADHSTLKVNILGTSKISSFNTDSSKGKPEHIQIHAGSRNHASPHFLVHYQTANSHWAEVYHMDHTTSAITKAYDLPALAGRGAFSVTTVDANVYFTRITEEEQILLSSASHGVLARWTLKDIRLPMVKEHVYPIHAVSEVVTRDASTYAVRSAVLLSSGDWILVRNGEKDWSRLESLASIVKAAWVPSTGSAELAQALEVETRTDPVSAYFHRIGRHIADFASVQLWLSTLPQLISEKLPAFGAKSDLSPAQMAYFGFDKLVLAATEDGRIVALEPGNHGRVAWNLKATELQPRQKWTAAAAGPVVDQLLATGGPLLEANAQSPDFGAWEKLLAELSQKAAAHQPPLPAGSVTYTVKEGTLQGYRNSVRLWQFSPPPGQILLDTNPAMPDEPIASIGKALGDRSVLYKYLNPNAVLATAINPARRELHLYLLDAVSGTVLYSTTHNNVDTSRAITSLLTENWFAYSFTTDARTDSTSKGYQLVVSELLESFFPNSRGLLADATNSSSTHPSALASPPVAHTQTYHVPEEISAMAVTQTAQGITSRELLVGLASSGSIVEIPRMALDPRRTVGADPSRAQLEEGLTRYNPYLDFPAQWHLTHKQDVYGIKKIVTSPALLESTSLVFAYGNDVFGTRVAPSFAFDVLGDGFNKVQLVLTVVALTLGTVGVAPLIQRKQTNMLWANS